MNKETIDSITRQVIAFIVVICITAAIVAATINFIMWLFQ